MISLDRTKTSFGNPTGFWLSGALVFLALMPRLALAQTPARPFADLQSILKTGDEVQITDSSGKVSHGRIVGVSTSSLGLTVDGLQRDLSAATIREVKKRRPDLWWNGVLIGAVVGTVVGAVVKERSCGSTDCGEGGLVDPGFYVFGAVFGAGAGALVDHSIRRFDTVFASRSPASVQRLSLSLVLSRDTKGLRFSVTF
jgi:hypothetical protein